MAHHRFVTVLITTILTCGLAAGADRWVPLTGGPEPTPPLVTTERSSTEVYAFEIEVPGVELTAVESDGTAFTVVALPGAGRIGAPGEPRLPAFRRFVELPWGATPALDVQVLETEVVDLAALGLPPLVFPEQLPVPKCDCPELRAWRFSYDADAYRGVVAHPLLEAAEPVGFRDHRMSLLTFAPVRYDVAGGRLEIVTRARVTVAFKGGDETATRAARERLASPHFDAFLGGATLNLQLGAARDAGWGYPAAAPIDFLIVTPPQFVADLQPFVDWKTSTGYRVTVATTDVTGTTTTDIKTYITGLYNGPNPPVYVLMIGDAPTPMPTFTTTNAVGGTDLMYVQMDTDLYPDMMIARWPVDDAAELIAMRDKILFYEQPTAANSAWLNRALFLGGDDYTSRDGGTRHGMTTHQDVMAQLFDPAPNSADTAYWEGNNNPTTAELIADVNTGRGWVVYSAHSGPTGWAGDPPLSSSDMPSFANTAMYPVSHGHSCSSNEFSNHDDVFGEAAVIQPDKGFVSYWGGSNSTYWDEDDWLERAFFDSMFDIDMSSPSNMIPYDRQYSVLASCYSGLTEVTLQGSSRETYYWQIYNLNGDPTLDPFTRQPVGMTVDAPAVAPPVAGDLAVAVSDSVGAVAGALVAVSQDGALLGAAFTDAGGNATVPITAPAADTDLLVRVTAHNHLPTDAAVRVAAGSDGVVVLDRGVYDCQASATIQVFDDDLDGVGPFTVSLTAAPAGGSTDVTLTQTSTDPVTFATTVSLAGVLPDIAHGDVVTVTYLDADDGAGGVNVPKTDAAVMDCAPPAISGVQVTSARDAVTVTFTTDEPGDTALWYGTATPPMTFVSEPGLVLDHEITVDGLAACTRYFLEVGSADALYNAGSDTNGGEYYQVVTEGWVTALDESFDADPGWTIDNGGNANGWAFGTPTGAGGAYGEPDPTAGHTGVNVYGVNLAGDYDNSLTENHLKLTTPPVDCSALETVELSYWRWLGVEKYTYDRARVLVSIDGGTSWTEVWVNGSSDINGGSWEHMTHDLTALAAGQPDVRIRWTLGKTDGSWQWCGWNLDDVTVAGSAPCPDMIFADGFDCGSCQNWSADQL